jgi:uncharacterized membrane protein YdjX (TVP38/TMEM64 family)
MLVVYYDAVQTVLISAFNYIAHLDTFEGALVLSISNVIGALFMMPCVPFTLAAGFLYGNFLGSCIVVLASNFASVVSFLVARYVARGAVESHLSTRKNSKWRSLDKAIKGCACVFVYVCVFMCVCACVCVCVVCSLSVVCTCLRLFSLSHTHTFTGMDSRSYF